MKPILFQYFEETANYLLSKYKRSSLQRASSNLGRNREMFCRGFLENVLPRKLSVESGEIWDSFGSKTGQLDLIIIRNDAPAIDIGTENVFLTEGVFAVIEIKSNLTRERLRTAATTLEKVENLKCAGLSFTGFATTQRPLRIVFAYKGANFKTLSDEIHKNEWEELFDLICILNRGALVRKDIKGLGKLFSEIESEDKLIPLKGKAIALGSLYYCLVKLGSKFGGYSFNLEGYFKPITSWES